MENLTPVYSENGACYKSGCLVPDFDEMANGYRLPTDAEWIWAAQGADQSCNDDSIEINTIDNVTWHKGNSSAAAVNMDNGRGTWPVGRKQPNCLGIFDMRGNVCEWCASKPAGKMSRSCSSTRGGSWNDQAESSAMPVLCIRYPQERSNEIGFRIARSL